MRVHPGVAKMRHRRESLRTGADDGNVDSHGWRVQPLDLGVTSLHYVLAYAIALPLIVLIRMMRRGRNAAKRWLLRDDAADGMPPGSP
jgi:hypothetical protein